MPSQTPLDVPPAPDATAAETPELGGWRGDLLALRAELDRIDNRLHELLMQRARVVEQVAKSGKRSAYRPGREATIIRRLLHRHQGALPPQTIVRLWRELLAGTTAMQGPFAVTVYEPDGAAAGLSQVAREHFGALTVLRAHARPSQVLAEVTQGSAAVGILPMPAATDTSPDPWWTAMLRQEQPRIYIVARLPFWAPRPEGSPAMQALVIAATAPDASEHDRSLLGLEFAADVSRARLTAMLAEAGLGSKAVTLHRDGAALALVDVAGFLTDDDARLTRLEPALRRCVVLGAYAVPEPGAAL